MLKIKSLTMKNFLSIGNVTQSISFSESEIYLIIGENLDLGGNDNRNGVGKTTIINGLSYALYGKPLVSIKLENLINKTNGKKMMVTIEFEKDGKKYRVERGRKPTKLQFFQDDSEISADTSDESQGENRLTQQEIERVLGISHDMFKMIIALNTYTEPFLSMRAADQRDIIEQLLGITKLSEKAVILKELLKETRDSIKEETFRIDAVKEANRRIETNIKLQESKSRAWDSQHETLLKDSESALETLLDINIDEEIDHHNKKAVVKENLQKLKTYKKELKMAQDLTESASKNLQKLSEKHDTAEGMNCPTCGTVMDDETHSNVLSNIVSEQEKYTKICDESAKKIISLSDKIDKIHIDDEPSTFYDDISQAYEHKTSIHTLETTLEKERNLTNPYIENIENLKDNGLQVIEYDHINDLEDTKNHQEFLLKLLTNKDSFIRKKIINQNLLYLNKRLEGYLSKVGLPHQVSFQSDLNVEIQEHGRDLDFDNLSRGERTRLILSLSWAFRDVYESLNHKINLLFIDELIDSGLDVNGVEASLSVLKRMTRDDNRCVHLISHRDELMGRVDNVLTVIKEGGFTSISLSDDI